MQHWKLSTAGLFEAERERAWRHAMSEICLPPGLPEGPQAFAGDMVNVVSPVGIEFSLVHAGPQTLSGACQTHRDAIWLALLLEGGCASAGEAQSANALANNDVLYGPTGVDSTLQLHSDFSMLYVKIPRQVLKGRLLNPALMGGMGSLSGSSGSGRILALLLRAVAEGIDELTDRSIRPIEAALAEFVIACLGEKLGPEQANPGRSAHLHQICQSLEAQLGDPALSLAGIAAQQRVSVRYIQKLFEEAGESFGQYVRRRRLENCHSELANPLYRGSSVSEICFRWGFNDAAHFSRRFHQMYGQSPRSFRREAMQDGDAAVQVMQ